MENIKSVIRDSIVQPGLREASMIKTIARVIDSDERHNVCTIRFNDYDGEPVTIPYVPVQVNKETSGWFPKEKDLVEIEKERKYVKIIAPVCDNYEQEDRPKKRLKQDICSNGYHNTIPGAIF